MVHSAAYHGQRPRAPARREPAFAKRFDVASTTPAWVSDITYIATREGWL